MNRREYGYRVAGDQMLVLLNQVTKRSGLPGLLDRSIVCQESSIGIEIAQTLPLFLVLRTRASTEVELHHGMVDHMLDGALARVCGPPLSHRARSNRHLMAMKS